MDIAGPIGGRCSGVRRYGSHDRARFFAAATGEAITAEPFVTSA